MTKDELISEIKSKRSFLCIGLDTDIEKIPVHLLKSDDPVFEFNRQIIDATHHLCIAYKPNLAFYESLGIKGWQSLSRTIEYLRNNHPEIFTIADAKRGDIGNTSLQYAKAFLDDTNGFGFDAITVAPYMGSDSVKPFLQYSGKWAIILALTSNKGAEDFQFQVLENNAKLFEQVLRTTASWGSSDNTMFVVGATKAPILAEIRKTVPDHFLLVPGIGAQGGSLAEVVHYGLNRDIGLIINASRSVIYAADNEDFADEARKAAEEIQQEMKTFIDKM
ncbi:MAG: orotidine-5'-phosphate decarboxylase [Bacteroidales bacterium]|jgi:orotidine-5'-phosphate decarboxylase|nr:orotidine-5'-phosphate decarboxylase [Bacteroidales bacterium]